MMDKAINLGSTQIQSATDQVQGEFVEINGESFYKIRNYHEMPDFFISIVSDSDYWMYISSNGSLTAGRKDRDNVLFPYYTEDKIHDYQGITGSVSCFLVERRGKIFLWEPFTAESRKVYRVTRNIYKSIYGNKIIFEEINSDLELGFQYGWSTSEKFGFVKKSSLKNHSNFPVWVDMLDGLRNIMPHGVDYAFQNEFSNLLDAYKKNERVEHTTLGLFMLSSIPVDRPEPSEALKTTTVWSLGPQENTKILISDRQFKAFINGLPVETENDIRAHRGAYFINSRLDLGGHSSAKWMTVAQINQDSADVADLTHFLKSEKNIPGIIKNNIELGTLNLEHIVAKADGLQLSNEKLNSARHFSNTLFNVMRGGVYIRDYRISTRDFKQFVQQTNASVFNSHQNILSKLPEETGYPELLKLAENSGSRDLLRIVTEYLPLTFSRRHGDPSRPWNRFSIDTRNPDGSVRINYEGNWRDIFQNWEALNLSFPEYAESIICKFLNASTADGYNPYRITRKGVDWECPNPNEPWAHIGYWGDHQVIYLQKFLEQSYAFHPGKLEVLFSREIFVYANVPYRIKPYDEIVQNPKETISFDSSLNGKIEALVEQTGADGRLIKGAGGQLYYVNLAEKILVTTLTKLSNFIPEAGIWLNTQRPEWNDANNALVGNGASMITLYYLRRSLTFWNRFFENIGIGDVSISEEVTNLFHAIHRHLSEYTDVLKTGFSDKQRESFTRDLGTAGSEYRQRIYRHSFSEIKKDISLEQLKEFTALALKFIDQSIAKNKRKDGLYHAYNLVSFNSEGISIRFLYEMLEGQVAVLSSGYLPVEESLELLDALKASKLFRADQYSYILYPDRHLPRFDEKNNIPRAFAEKSNLLQALIHDRNDSIVSLDDSGHYHFDGSFRNAAFLKEALEKLDSRKYGKLVKEEKDSILMVYEKMFDHQSFTGRSGTFFGYEGLGSIYWHMVSKLLLATQECYFRAVDEGSGPEITGRLKDHFYEIKAGIGLYKSPKLYGAFPTDAYSHTPAHAGVKQPGLTGQVKEDVISRFGELGIRIREGEIHFDLSLLNPDELLKETAAFQYLDMKGNREELELSKGQMAFTFCQVPVVISGGEKETVTIVFSDGREIEIEGNRIGKELSGEIYRRSGVVRQVKVELEGE